MVEVTFLFNVGAIWLVLWCERCERMRLGLLLRGGGYVRLFLGMTWRDPVGARRSEVVGTFFSLSLAGAYASRGKIGV